MIKEKGLDALKGFLLLIFFSLSTLAWGDTKTLDQITVTTATKTEVNLKDAPASTSVITREELKKRPVKDLVDIIRESTGITLAGRGVGGRKVITIRGMESHQSLILIDGKRISATDNVLGHSDFQNSWLPIDAIERIEIVRGPLSALYGSEALGGVVNIITRAVPDKWSGNIHLQAGFADDLGGDESKVGFYASGPLGKKAGLTLSGTWSTLDKRATKGKKEITELEGKEIKSLLTKLTVKPVENHTIELGISKVGEDRARDANSRGRPPVLHESGYDLNRTHISLTHNGKYKNATSQLKIYKSEFKQINMTSNGVRPTVPQTLTDKALDGHMTFPVGNKHLLTIGGEFRQEGLIHSALAKGKSEIEHKALFIQDEIELSEKLLLTVGLRADDHEKFGSELSPRIYMVYHATDKLSIKGGFGHGFKAPTIKQVSPEYKFVGHHSFVGNADVGPESSDNFEVGMSYTGYKHKLGVTAFRNTIEDLIDTKCIIDCAARSGRTFTYVNIEKARTQGIETELGFNLTKSLDLNFNYTYLDATNRTTGLRLNKRPRHSANARLNWKSDAMGLNLSLRSEYIGSQVDYDRGGNKLDLPSYALWHLGANKRIGKKLTVSAGIENIGDVYLADKSENFGYSERGRFYYVGLNAEF